jgi:hypothetical protein
LKAVPAVKPPKELVVLRYICLAAARVFTGVDHPHELRHTAILIRELLAVQHICAGEHCNPDKYQIVPIT